MNSWKEIAAYLNRDPRTVQLWEKHEGLPVRRITHLSRASVYALTAEIDAWMRSRSGPSESAMSEVPNAPWRQPRFALPRRRATYLALLTGFVLALLLAAALWAWHSRRAQLAAPLPMLVVVPFENQTSSDEFLVDALTEDLTQTLSRSGAFQVISWRSASSLRGRHLPLHQLAGEFHASLVIQGTVAEVGDQATVTVELLDTVHEAHLWGASYTRKSVDMLSSQNDIAATITTAISKRITGAPPHTGSQPPQADSRVRQAYLAGRFFWNQRNLPALQKAIASFHQAIAIDPKYAPAYAGLADCYDLMTDRGVLSDDQAFGRARAASQQALALDPSSAEAYNALAFATYRQDWDFAGAERYFLKAIQLDPNDAVAHQWYGEFLGDMRRFDESIVELRKARQLDPLAPMVGADLADGYFHAGRLADAELELKRILELYPDFVPAHQYLAAVYLEKSDLPAARAEAQIFAARTGDPNSLRRLDIQALMTSGKTSQARAAVRTQLLAGKSSRVDSFQAAQLFFLTGENDAGYATLEKAYREHSWWLVTMLVDPGFRTVRDQPRFRSLAHRVGLPDTPALMRSAIPLESRETNPAI